MNFKDPAKQQINHSIMNPTLWFSILLLSLIQLATAATNETTASSTTPKFVDEFSTITKLTDMDSLSEQHPLCLRSCFRQIFVDAFKIHTNKCGFTETKGAKIDWRCICYSEASDLEPSGVDAAELNKLFPKEGGNTTALAVLKQYVRGVSERFEKCAEEQIKTGICEAKVENEVWGALEVVFDNFENYCIQRFGANYNLTGGWIQALGKFTRI